tara:strand:- start:850 stop:2313 length:1464 start_codon:yes stop_codon:yes gene_type:complete
MKVLFLYTNINGFHADGFGDGIAQIMSVTKKAGYDIANMQIFEKSEYSQLEDLIINYRPDVVGFTSVSSQFSYVLELTDIIKKISQKIITVCGGVHTTLYPQCVLENKNLDAVFIGESEYPFLDFLKKIENNLSWKDSDNIAYNDNGKLKKNKMRKLLSPEELELLPHPDRKTYSLDKVLQMTGLAPFHFTRGCPFTCTYCSNIGIAKVYDKARFNIRQASPEYAIQELEETIKQYPTIGPVYKIYLTDDIFGLNKKWRREFLALYREKIKIPFACLMRCDVVTEDTMQDLAKGYCYRIQFGVESGNDYIRNVVMDREMPRDTIIRAFELAKKYGVETYALNVIGVPGETKEMLMDTVKLNCEINPTASGANIFYPYKGTPLGDKSFDDGMVNIEKYNDFSNERRESVMNYSEEWLETLKYYRANWESVVYPFTYKRAVSKSYYGFKQMISNIPYFGPIIRNNYQKAKKRIMMRTNRKRTDLSWPGR